MFASPLPDVSIPDQSVYDYLFGDLDPADGARTAITDGRTGITVDYATLVAQIDAVAAGLADRGVRPGDVVALHAPNTPTFAVVFHGILRLGATVTTVNALFTGPEVASQLRTASASMLITVSPLLGPATEAATLVGLAPEQVIVLDGAEGHASFRDLQRVDNPAPAPDVDASSVAALPFSSGTMGRPKGVMLTHRNLVANVQQARDLVDVRPDDVVLALLPFFHIYGMTVLLNIALRARAQLVTMAKFDLVEFLRLIQDHRCTYVFVAPPVAVALAKHPLVDEYDLSSVRVIFSGAAPLDEATADAVAQRLGCRVVQGYGMTEMSPVSHVTPPARHDIPVGSVGITIPNMRCKLLDIESGVDIPVPQSGVSRRGELLCAGPNIMAGYLGDPESTADIIDAQGFLHTGDVATVSAEGFVTIVDRIKELIKYKGYQVAPAELEALLLTHPQISDAAVIAATDESGEEVPKAFVVLQPAATLSADDVIAYVADRVAPYKKVRQVEVIDSIPKSASGKILRKDLRARAMAP